MNQTYHLEALGFGERGSPAAVLQRQTIRSDSLERVRQRAVQLLRRSQTPQWTGGRIEAVQVTDGSDAEMFRWSIWDEMTTSAGR